jgi:uncharacterized integral membrane protein
MKTTLQVIGFAGLICLGVASGASLLALLAWAFAHPHVVMVVGFFVVCGLLALAACTRNGQTDHYRARPASNEGHDGYWWDTSA